MRSIVFFVVVICISLTEAAKLSKIILDLPSYQTETGGFRNNALEQPSIKATANALFLTSLFGLKDKINSYEVSRFLPTLENGDYGYGETLGSPSDLESVKHALSCYQHLGATVPNSGNLVSYIKSLKDNSGLFSSRVGEKPSLESTVHALQSLQYLGEGEKPYVTELKETLSKWLSKFEKTEAGTTHFSFPSEKLDQVTANYYGVLLGNQVGYKLKNVEQWAKWIKSLANPAGGYNKGTNKKEVSLTSTAHAVAALHALNQHTEDILLTGVSVSEYIASAEHNLNSAALSYLAIAFTNDFRNNFVIDASYDALDSAPVKDSITQGTQLKPTLSVKTFGLIAHPGLEVSVDISYESGATASKLQWSQDSQKYVAYDLYDSAEKLGDVVFVYSVKCFVVGVGEIGFTLKDSKKIGYGMTVTSSAYQAMLHKEIQPNELVSIGTEFKFSLTLSNQTEKNIKSGNFEVLFDVLDSSHVPISSKVVDAKKETPFSFEYVFSSANIPSGALSFRFTVKDKALNIVHSSRVIDYALQLPMIATEIKFSSENTKFKIGSSVEISMVPASYPDLRTVHTFDSKDVSGKDTSSVRKFYMDIATPSGNQLQSVVGSSVAGDKLKYKFTLPITATLDAIGKNVISFRYVTESGDGIALSNYDSTVGELYDDSFALNYTVDAELLMFDVKEKPQGDRDFFYGNEISFKFKLKDSVSGQTVVTGNTDQNVYLSLQHMDEERAVPFVSVKQPATQEGEYFVIRWEINPNAVKGDGLLILNSQDIDGNVVEIFSKKNEPVKYSINIGGEINANSETFVTNTEENAVFAANFDLECKNKILNNALLRCAVHLKDKNGEEQLVTKYPVTTGENGRYQVSWTTPLDASKAGEYILKFYRETDIAHALDSRAFREKKQRKENAIKGIVTEPTKKEIEEEISPLFTVSVDYEGPERKLLPVRLEVLVTLALGGAFFFVASQRP